MIQFKRRKSPTLALMVLFLAALIIMAGCTSQSKVQLVEDKINVVTTFYPLYNFAQSIGGEHVNVINLVPAGVEPHDWTPKSRDLTNMTKAELFIYNGAGFEGWVHDFLDSKKESNQLVIEASTGITLIAADPEAHTEQDHEHKGDHGHDHDDSEFDPHVWTSPKSARVMAEAVKNGLIQADAANKATYEANFQKLDNQLAELDKNFTDSLSKVVKKEIVVSHQAFSYLARDYGLTQKAIMGLSPDAEPTSKQIVEINKFVKENNVKAIFFEELVSDKLAKTLANDAKIDTLVLNPLEGLTDEQMKAGENYISIMEKNLQNLMKALQ